MKAKKQKEMLRSSDLQILHLNYWGGSWKKVHNWKLQS